MLSSMPIRSWTSPALSLAVIVLVVSACASPNAERTGSGDGGRATETSLSPAMRRRARDRATIRPDEIRAVWVDTWAPGLYSADEIDELIAWCERGRINTILAEVRKIGDAYYRSDREPRGLVGSTGRPVDESFDPLDYLIQEARGRGMRVEAWLVANRIWKGKGEPPAGHVLREHPEWRLINRQGSGDDGAATPSVFLDPSEPGVRRHLADVAADIVARYPVDGIHLDYIRYPGKEWGYGEASLARFREATGFSGTPSPDDARFSRWRMQQVTEQVSTLRRAIRRIDDDVELSAATITWGELGPAGYAATRGAHDCFQNWPAWCEQGLIDVHYPMHYKREFEPRWREDFRRWLDLFARLERDTEAQQVIGLGAYLNDIAGTRAQLAALRARGLESFCIFSYHAPNRGTAHRRELANALVDH
jgi:uncharacterized lipoprotein YddW (UPF0748 family)